MVPFDQGCESRYQQLLGQRIRIGTKDLQIAATARACGLIVVTRKVVDHPEEDSVQLAARLSKQIGQPMRPDAFRKQVSRARHQFARLMVDEVKATLSEPTPEQVHEELREVGLLGYVRREMATANER